MRIENFFLRYAYPCAYIIMHRGELSQTELKELEKIAIENREISRERLERIFHRAFAFIDEFAEKYNAYRWDPFIIKEYFYSFHNEVIDAGAGTYKTAPETLKELSRVEKAKIIDKRDNILFVEYTDKKGNKKTRNVFNSFVSNAKIKDTVTIHYGYAIEIVEE